MGIPQPSPTIQQQVKAEMRRQRSMANLCMRIADLLHDPAYIGTDIAFALNGSDDVYWEHIAAGINEPVPDLAMRAEIIEYFATRNPQPANPFADL